jgi:hypothetical protein
VTGMMASLVSFPLLLGVFSPVAGGVIVSVTGDFLLYRGL